MTAFDNPAYQEAIRPAREARELAEAEAAKAAEELWASFDENERALVRFGMLPAEKVQAKQYEHIDGRLLACALYRCADNDGGMVM